MLLFSTLHVLIQVLVSRTDPNLIPNYPNSLIYVKYGFNKRMYTFVNFRWNCSSCNKWQRQEKIKLTNITYINGTISYGLLLVLAL